MMIFFCEIISEPIFKDNLFLEKCTITHANLSLIVKNLQKRTRLDVSKGKEVKKMINNYHNKNKTSRLINLFKKNYIVLTEVKTSLYLSNPFFIASSSPIGIVENKFLAY